MSWRLSDLPPHLQDQAREQLGQPESAAKPPEGVTASKRARKPREQPERNLQTQVIEDLEALGYLAMHPRPARTAEGWRTPVEGTYAAGYPDVTAVHPNTGRVVIAELKAGKNRPSNEQLAWLRAWMLAPGVTVLVVRPENWDELRSLL